MEDEEINAETIQDIRKPLEDEEINADAADDDANTNAGDRHRLQPKLPSELGSESEQEAKTENTTSKEVGKCSNEEIIKELRNVKRQNTITHYLLTGLIAVTLVWQLSEYHLVLKIKDGFRNPFKSVEGIFKGLLKNRKEVGVQDVMKQATEMHKQVTEPTTTYLPGLRIPELPHLDLPGFDSDDGEDD